MIIGGLRKLTLIDYPGKVACAVFTLGCNFRCHFCYNSELVTQKRENGRKDAKDYNLSLKISEQDFFDFLSQRKGILDGVCVTGGEPTIHADLEDFLRKIKEMGFLVKLDTNGTNPEMLKKLLNENLLDYIAMDLKTHTSYQLPDIKYKTYNEVAGVAVKLKDIRESIRLIRESGVDYEFRTTIVPGLHAKGDILAIAEELKGAKKYYLQQFKQDEKIVNPDFRTAPSYGKDFLEEIRREIKDFFEVCEIRGD